MTGFSDPFVVKQAAHESDRQVGARERPCVTLGECGDRSGLFE